MSTSLITVLLLIGSNLFMTFAWYGHLKFGADSPLWRIIGLSWGLAFFEYCLMVPANRIGYRVMSGFQLKILQEVITLVVFAAFAVWVLQERLRWNYIASFGCLLPAVAFVLGFPAPKTTAR